MLHNLLVNAPWYAVACVLGRCCFLLQVPRQQLIQVDLLDQLPMGTADLQVPAGGLTVPHIRTGAHTSMHMCHSLCKESLQNQARVLFCNSGSMHKLTFLTRCMTSGRKSLYVVDLSQLGQVLWWTKADSNYDDHAELTAETAAVLVLVMQASRCTLTCLTQGNS
jgi:hypothetical protein